MKTNKIKTYAVDFIKLNTSDQIDKSGCEFQSWHYMTISFCFEIEDFTEMICLDMRCTMSLIDQSFLSKHLSDLAIQQIQKQIMIQEIGSWTHECQKYVCLNLYLSDKLNRKITTVYIAHKIHLMNNLQTNLLIDMDIIGLKWISMNISSQKTILKECQNMLIDLQITSWPNRQIWCIVWFFHKVIILSNVLHQIFIKIERQLLSANQDLIFTFTYQDVYNHVVDANISFVHVQNDLSNAVTLSCHTYLDVISEYEEKECYTVSIENINLAVHRSLTRSDNQMSEICLSNDITIYSTPTNVAAIADVIKTYSDLWHDCRRTVDIFERNYLQVPLKKNWETTKLLKWVYLLSDEARWLVNEKFDELHAQGQMEWSTQPTPFGFLVFVVWKTIILDGLPRRKGHIQELNQISQPNSYPLPLQTDITSAVQECHYILTVDCAFFFYQWLVNPADQHKFTVISHQEQEHFNVVIMKYHNSSLYVQHQMNSLLWPFHAFVRRYIDDIVIFSCTLEDHITHLNQVFSLFQKLEISLELKKFFLEYLIITLLGQQVDTLELITVSEKIQTIASLQFPVTLKALEIYLDLISWLCFYIFYYVQITAPLQACKTALLKALSVFKENAWKQHSHQITVDKSTSEEPKIFEILQNLFTVFIFLAHFKSDRQLYINVNAFKQYGFSAVVYYVQSNPDSNLASVDAKVMKFPHHKIQSILFLSKLLTPVKHNYWSTEMKTADLIWIVCKTRHLIESVSKSTIVFTDHSAIIFIAH